MTVHSITPRKVRLTPAQRAALRHEAEVRGLSTTELIDEAIRDLATSISEAEIVELPDHSIPRASVRVSTHGWRLLQQLPDQATDRAIVRASACDLLSAALSRLASRQEPYRGLSDQADLPLYA